MVWCFWVGLVVCYSSRNFAVLEFGWVFLCNLVDLGFSCLGWVFRVSDDLFLALICCLFGVVLVLDISGLFWCVGLMIW